MRTSGNSVRLRPWLRYGFIRMCMSKNKKIVRSEPPSCGGSPAKSTARIAVRMSLRNISTNSHHQAWTVSAMEVRMFSMQATCAWEHVHEGTTNKKEWPVDHMTCMVLQAFRRNPKRSMTRSSSGPAHLKRILHFPSEPSASVCVTHANGT